jgi:hypothetical protein
LLGVFAVRVDGAPQLRPRSLPLWISRRPLFASWGSQWAVPRRVPLCLNPQSASDVGAGRRASGVSQAGA